MSDSKDEGLELRAEAEFKKQGTAAEEGMRAKAEYDAEVRQSEQNRTS